MTTSTEAGSDTTPGTDLDGVEGPRLKERVPERAQWIVSRIVLVISFASCELLADTLMVA